MGQELTILPVQAYITFSEVAAVDFFNKKGRLADGTGLRRAPHAARAGRHCKTSISMKFTKPCRASAVHPQSVGRPQVLP